MMKVIDRRASDNKYLHKDFHISMNMLLGYIHDEYGPEAVTEYLAQFSRAFHSPINKNLREGRLELLERYFKGIYEKEEWPAFVALKDDALTVSQESCPGIVHIKNKGYEPVEQYIETYTTVYKTMCEGTPYKYVMEKFDPETGACRQRFQRRAL